MNKKAVWDFWAKRYERLWVQRFFLTPTRIKVLELMEKYMSMRATRILDIGCGIGQLAADIRKRFANRGLEITAVDFSREMIERAKQNNEGIDFLELDVEDLLNLEGEYDVIVCTHSLPYYKDQKKAISDMAVKLRDGGILILAHASANSLYDRLIHGIVKWTAGGAKYPSVADIIQMCDKRLKIVEVDKLHRAQIMTTILFTVFKKVRGSNEDIVD